MSGKLKQFKAYKVYLEKQGFEIISTEINKHCKVKARYRGVIVTFILPLSPSDNARSFLNWSADVRRAKAKINAGQPPAE